MARVLRICRELDHYLVCTVEADRQKEEYYVVSQGPIDFKTPLEAVLAVEMTAKRYHTDDKTVRACAECLNSYAQRGAVTELDGLYALLVLNDDTVPLDGDVPDLLGEFMESRRKLA